jgi:LacI family transcriptional regulator
MKRKVRIKDIARMANVSVGTVDRVIHRRGEVSEESFRKIMAILEKTGYEPNLIARSLSSGKTFQIVVLIPNPTQDEYWKMAEEGVRLAEEEWAHHRVHIKVSHFNLYNKSSFKKAAQALLKTKPDGVLTAPIFHQEALDFFAACQKKKIPFVTFNNNVTETEGLGYVGQDLYQSGQVGAELLQIDQKEPGTYAILHIYDDISNSTHLKEKERGFMDYFLNLNGSQNKVTSLDLNMAHRQTLEKDLMKLLKEKSLKGLLVTTSKGASVVSQVLEKHGKNGIRLVAYDLLQENLNYLNKGIIDFLINQNSRRQAFTGVGQLANYLVFKKEPRAPYLFPLEIITRQNLSSYLRSMQH